MSVYTTWVDSIAVITLDNPPVNVGDAALRRNLRDELLAVSAAAELDGVVIASAGRHFYSGSDIKEFDRSIEEPQLTGVIAVIEAMPVPIVAAITGLALGGGLELALACDDRVADNTVEIGFPEVTLGIIPGAGGTVRATRLVGPITAIDVITTGRRFGAIEAHRLGFLDEVVSPDKLRDAAVRRAATKGRRLVRDRPVPAANVKAVEDAARRVEKKERPAATAAAKIVLRGIGMDFDEALADERALFQRLRVSKESENLRYLFLAERAVAGRQRAHFASPVNRVGVAGSGTMGATVARLFAAHDFAVTVFDSNPSALARISGDNGISVTNDIAGLAGSELVIDAVYEDMRTKRQLVKDVESVVHSETVIATNTSYLDIDEMVRGMQHPERVAGFHFFNPADRNKLVEIVRTATSNDITISTLRAVALKLGKIAVSSKVGEGFIANRVYSDYRTQAEFLVEEGASPEEVDAAICELGLPIGPFAVGDMSGLDIGWARRKRLAATRDPRQRYVSIPDVLCEMGRFGRKTGAGWYRYENGASRGAPDPIVSEVIDKERARRGISPRAIDVAEIQRRVLGSMVCAAARVMGDGVAERVSDIDVAMTNGFAFPRWLGGPVRYFAGLTEDVAARALSEVFLSDPVTFSIAEPRVNGHIPGALQSILQDAR